MEKGGGGGEEEGKEERAQLPGMQGCSHTRTKEIRVQKGLTKGPFQLCVVRSFGGDQDDAVGGAL
jgi:hypothetical protein